MTNTKIELGGNVTDIITGFTGTVTGLVKYLTGCDQALVTPKSTDSAKYPEANWFDINRLEVNDVKLVVIDTSVDNGAMDSPPGY